MELICEFIKSGKQPEGYTITETKNGKYRLTKLKDEKETLEAKRKRLLKSIEDIDNELKKYAEVKVEEAKPDQE